MICISFHQIQWWINGHCIKGVKEEVSELHRCMKPDGSRSYCHDCNDGLGNIKNVCGSDNPSYEEVCEIAWGKSADNCGEQGLTVYSHQCKPSEPTESWYLREDYSCNWKDLGESDWDITCGQEWFFCYSDGDNGYGETSNNPDHPFANKSHGFCLDCGLAIQVCASSIDATCTNLGLPEKGLSVPKVEASQGETSTTTPKVISTATSSVTPSPSTSLGEDPSTTETSSSGKDSMSTASTSTTGTSTSDTSQGGRFGTACWTIVTVGSWLYYLNNII